MEVKRTLKPITIVSHDVLGFELLQGSTKVHLNHLLITGQGSYAAHKAMNSFYDDVADLADNFIEQYQGCTEKLMIFPTSFEFPVMKTADDCISYLRDLYKKVTAVQNECPYSEIKNTLDEVKSLINSTKYKLLFLK